MQRKGVDGMNWNYHVFKIDDPDTWPNVDCPILVWKPHNDWPCIYQWDPRGNCFVDDFDSYYPNKCLYAYIGYMPYIDRELHPAKCKADRYLCSNYDDGYCFGEDTQCKGIEVVTEYVIECKRIWRQFGEG